jgi:hypothetical protein
MQLSQLTSKAKFAAVSGVMGLGILGAALGSAANAFAEPTDNSPGSLGYCMSGGWSEQTCNYYGNQPWAYSTSGHRVDNAKPNTITTAKFDVNAGKPKLASLGA